LNCAETARNRPVDDEQSRGPEFDLERLGRLLSRLHQLEGAITTAIVQGEAAARLTATDVKDPDYDTRLARDA
jgi:hypothetical protein